MAGRGRRIAVALILLALVLSAGRWGSAFLSERLWEAAVSKRVAVAGTERALLTMGLELSVVLLAIVWFFAQFSIAARIALPERPPPEQDAAKIWPAQLPRWSLAVLAIVMGALLGSGAGEWLNELLLVYNGVHFGVTDPLLGADLGVFVRHFPLWLDLQRKGTLLIAAALGGVLLLHLAGETIRVAKRGVLFSPRVRGQLAMLLALLALVLGWSCALEPYRLAAGLRGPLLASEFLWRSRLAQLELTLAVGAALCSVLWWFRLRGLAAFLLWVLFSVTVIIGRILPLQSKAAVADPLWQSAARGLDSVAYQLAGLEGGMAAAYPPAASVIPSLWDDAILARVVADSGSIPPPRRGWLPVGTRSAAVWFAVRQRAGQSPALLAASDDRVSLSGGLLSWPERDTTPFSGVITFRELTTSVIRPLAPEVVLSREGSGVVLDSWAKRIVLAWALQAPSVFSAASGTRVAWRLDPAIRLGTVAPFAHWTAPRARMRGTALFWESDGLLSSGLFPSSTRIEWAGRRVSMVRSSFLGIVNAESGAVRIFRRDPADSLAAAWARITNSLIEPPDAIPADLRAGEAYPEELLLAQTRVLEGVPWSAGKLERLSDGTVLLPPSGLGGGDYIVPFVHPSSKKLAALLAVRRTVSGDSLRLIRLDSLSTVATAATLRSEWEPFPFQLSLSDSVKAAGAVLEGGRVRYVLTEEGVLAYQPAWSVPASDRAQLVLINIALARNRRGGPMQLGTGRSFTEAWRNLNFLSAPSPVGGGAEAILELARRLWRRADSAARRGDIQERERALALLRDILGPPRP